MEKISVIVPIYKVENYLERCVNSIRNQTYKNLEILLVDDGSPDRCGEMCDSYAKEDARITVIHKENGGLSDARNVGIEASTGEYLAFVDSDDWLDPDMLELLYKMVKKHGADIAECSWRNIYKDCIIEETTCTAEQIEGDNIAALEGMLDWKYFKPVAWNKLYHRSVISDIRYPKGKLHEDEFTTYKYFYAARKLVYIDVSRYNYDRSRTDSITGDKFREANLDACEALRERIDFFREHHIESLEEKMNNTYCWVLFDRLDRCIKEEVMSQRLDKIAVQTQQDLAFFKEQPILPEYYRKLVILSQGFEAYKNDYLERNTVEEA